MSNASEVLLRQPELESGGAVKAETPAARRPNHLRALEAESIYILREAAAEFARPVMLYSIGKDSSVLLRLAQKAFYPGKIPFPLMHVDTGYKFQEMYAFRDLIARESGVERFFSFRDEFGQWEPKTQRPEVWSLYNARVRPKESIRAFPLSNWTELDVWQYIYLEKIPINPLYYACERDVVVRAGQIIFLDGLFAPGRSYGPTKGEKIERVLCRFRSLGCVPCSGAVRSAASTVEEIVEEMIVTRTSERGTRVIDHDADSSMETKKREGYF